MELHENDLILYFWSAKVPKHVARREGDWQCLMVVRGATKKLEAEYRFRWYNSIGFDVPDEKNFFRIGPVPDTQEARGKMYLAIRGMGKMFAHVEEREVNGPPQALMAVLDSIPGLMFQRTNGEPKAGATQSSM